MKKAYESSVVLYATHYRKYTFYLFLYENTIVSKTLALASKPLISCWPDSQSTLIYWADMGYEKLFLKVQNQLLSEKT